MVWWFRCAMQCVCYCYVKRHMCVFCAYQHWCASVCWLNHYDVLVSIRIQGLKSQYTTIQMRGHFEFIVHAQSWRKLGALKARLANKPSTLLFENHMFLSRILLIVLGVTYLSYLSLPWQVPALRVKNARCGHEVAKHVQEGDVS